MKAMITFFAYFFLSTLPVARAAKRLKAEGAEGEAGMTIADRLEALSAAIDEEAERSGAARGGVLALTSAAGGKDGAIQPRAESLATVLTQVEGGAFALGVWCLLGVLFRVFSRVVFCVFFSSIADVSAL